MLGLIVRALAVWRLTQLVVDDEVTRPFRDAVNRRWPESKLSYLITCNACVSVWAALLMALAPAWLARVLAWSAFSILVDEWRDERAAAALQRRMRGAQPVPARPPEEAVRAAADHVGGGPGAVEPPLRPGDDPRPERGVPDVAVGGVAHLRRPR